MGLTLSALGNAKSWPPDALEPLSRARSGAIASSG